MTSSQSKVLGTVALVFCALCVYTSIGITHTTYIHGEYDEARVSGLLLALLVLPCLWLAGRLLGRNGRWYVALVGAADILQILLVLYEMICASRS